MLFTPEEALMVAHQISNALILLSRELVAHRDIKPDNILIKLPIEGGVSRRQILNNICHPGVTFALTDFGNHSDIWRWYDNIYLDLHFQWSILQIGDVIDFKTNDYKTMSKVVAANALRGGAPYALAPEITCNNCVGSGNG
jgi:serine/threonine protein kinase